VICEACGKAGRCVDPPTPAETQTLEHLPCDACDGAGCAACAMSGKLTLRGCPMLAIDSTTTNALRIAKFAKHGVLPEPGALMDQREIDLHAIDLVWAEQGRCQADLFESDHE